VDEFARECKEAARNLRRVDRDLRRALSSQVKERVAVPLAARIGSAAGGPWAPVLRAGTKARAGAEPTIVVGGSAPRVSGGATPRQLVYGAEFGGGSRLTAVPRSGRRRGYRVHSTRQFRANRRPFIFPTIAEQIPAVLDEYADIVSDTFRETGL
jgi:hypothetical protein